MFKKLAPRDVFTLVFILIGTWFCGTWVGGNTVANSLTTSYESRIASINADYSTRLEEALVTQSVASAKDFLDITEIFSLAVYDLVNMKCPEIKKQLQ